MYSAQRDRKMRFCIFRNVGTCNFYILDAAALPHEIFWLYLCVSLCQTHPKLPTLSHDALGIWGCWSAFLFGIECAQCYLSRLSRVPPKRIGGSKVGIVTLQRFELRSQTRTSIISGVPWCCLRNHKPKMTCHYVIHKFCIYDVYAELPIMLVCWIKVALYKACNFLVWAKLIRIMNSETIFSDHPIMGLCLLCTLGLLSCLTM